MEIKGKIITAYPMQEGNNSQTGSLLLQLAVQTNNPVGIKKSNTREVVSFGIASYKIRTNTIFIISNEAFLLRRKV